MPFIERNRVIQNILQDRLVALFFHQDVELAKEVVRACYRGGARILEFTHRGKFAPNIFEEISKLCIQELPKMILGVGSLTDAAQASAYMNLGADFVVTPVLRKDIAQTCNRRKILWIAGCGTLTEITQCEELGAEIVKLFPGNIYGPDFIKGVLAPQPWTSIMPTGGVTVDQENLKAWFDAGAVCVGMGSKLISKDILETKSFEKLTQRVQQVVQVIQNLK